MTTTAILRQTFMIRRVPFAHEVISVDEVSPASGNAVEIARSISPNDFNSEL